MFGELFGAAENLLRDASPDTVAGAAADHVGGMESNELVQHLQASLDNIPAPLRAELANTVLGMLHQNGTPEADVAAAGVATDDAKSGDTNAVSALLANATSDPAALRDAAVTFIKNNPDVVARFTPEFAQGILSKLTG